MKNTLCPKLTTDTIDEVDVAVECAGTR